MARGVVAAIRQRLKSMNGKDDSDHSLAPPMHEVKNWQHGHDYRIDSERQSERRTHWVIALTAVTMVVELIAGTVTGSMALLADGWHMATHVGALSIAAFAYYISRRYADDPRFTFGTGKVAVLGGYTSAVALLLVALLMAVESVLRLVEPVPVQFSQAMMVAWLGLAVNLVSAWLLGHGYQGDHHHHGKHQHKADHHHDHNLRAAYMHVLADALTSVLAIIALWTGARFGWIWMDPLMGIVGAVIISRWAIGLLRDSGRVLLDADNHDELEEKIRSLVDEVADVRIADLHIWRVGPKSHACILSLVTHTPQPVSMYKDMLANMPGLDHLTIEINECTPDLCPEEGTAD